MNRTTQRLFPRHLTTTDCLATPKALQAIAAYAAQRPGLEFGNYCSGWSDREGRRAYFAEARRIARDFDRVRDAVHAACYAGVTDADVAEASRSDRLHVEADGSIDYTTGQYWPTEYRAACARVLERAVTIAQARG